MGLVKVSFYSSSQIKCDLVSCNMCACEGNTECVQCKKGYTVCKKSILTLGKEAIILGCDIIVGKCLISMEAFGNSSHLNT